MENKVKFTYHSASSVSGSLHVVCSICNVIPQCAPSACSSNNIHHQPFNKITYQYSLSSYNSTALYQLNIFQNLFFFICWTILTNIYTSNSNHDLFVQVNCNCMWGTYLHRKATIQFRYKRKQMENKVQTHLPPQLHPSVDLCMSCAPFDCHPLVCSVCMLIQHSPPSAPITKLHINYISIFIILIQFYCLISTKYLLKSFSLICWLLLTNIFTCNSKYVITCT